MDPERQREIASQGGRAAHASGNAHQFNSEEARAAGARSHGGQHQQQASGSQQAGSGTRGGASQQHAQAGSQSHKNQQR